MAKLGPETGRGQVWGRGRRDTGRGEVALWAGPSGTGETAARVAPGPVSRYRAGAFELGEHRGGERTRPAAAVGAGPRPAGC